MRADHNAMLRRPIITEKATKLKEKSTIICFEVAFGANKIEVKRAVEALFKVKVAGVNLVSMPGKTKRRGRSVGKRPDWRKAYVRLAAGEKAIEFVEAV